MPRIPRDLLIESGSPVHKVWRAHDKAFLIDDLREKAHYLHHLNETFEKKVEKTQVHAICVMGNHSHEVYDIQDTLEDFSNFMRQHHGMFGQSFNRRHQRLGKVAHDRPRTQLVESDVELMRLVFYVHANPIRAGICNDAKDFVYSTHALYAYGRRKGWMTHITFPDWYLELGPSMRTRQRRYRKLFDAYLRQYGLIKIAWCHHGWGSDLWLERRRRQYKKLKQSRLQKNATSPP